MYNDAFELPKVMSLLMQLRYYADVSLNADGKRKLKVGFVAQNGGICLCNTFRSSIAYVGTSIYRRSWHRLAAPYEHLVKVGTAR